jgi:hypothetical protein
MEHLRWLCPEGGVAALTPGWGGDAVRRAKPPEAQQSAQRPLPSRPLPGRPLPAHEPEARAPWPHTGLGLEIRARISGNGRWQQVENRFSSQFFTVNANL